MDLLLQLDKNRFRNIVVSKTRMQVYVYQNPRFGYQLEKPSRRLGFVNSSYAPKFIQINFFCTTYHNWNMNLRLPPDPAMVVKSPKISTSMTLETHDFANKEEARETIFKVLKIFLEFSLWFKMYILPLISFYVALFTY